MFVSKSTIRLSAVLILLLLVGGCVVGDQLTTFTLHPDGSAEMVTFRSNLRSTEEGTKAANEIAEYKAKFDGRTEDELVRILEAGGMIVDASWVRNQPPLANLVHAHFPNAAAVEKFFTIKNEDGSFALKTQLKSDGQRRSLTCEIWLPAAKPDPESQPADVEQLRQSLANGISETRVALSSGSITAARGFTVARDKQSALLDARALAEIMLKGGKGELYLEWEVAP